MEVVVKLAKMGKKVAIIHDWLNGMRGGEKVLERVQQTCDRR